jgi:lipopolysaccharide export LptBFGC system permease protein LptF
VNSLLFWNERDRRNWAIGQYDLATAAMVNPVVTWYEGNDYSWQLLAQRAACVNGLWTFYNVTMVKTELHSKEALGVPVLHTNVLAMPEFSETPEQIRSEVRIQAAAELPGAKKTKKADLSLAEILNYLRLHPNPSPANQSLLYTKLEGRLATPWRSAVVVLIAIPFGAVSGRRNVFMGVAGSLAICFAYFVLQQLSLAMGAGGALAPWLAGWLPNLSFGLIGLVLTARIR